MNNLEILGLDRLPDTINEVEAAFRAKAKALHPDAGGDRAAFERLVEARERTIRDIHDPDHVVEDWLDVLIQQDVRVQTEAGARRRRNELAKAKRLVAQAELFKFTSKVMDRIDCILSRADKTNLTDQLNKVMESHKKLDRFQKQRLIACLGRLSNRALKQASKLNTEEKPTPPDKLREP
jgi:hypothetical protein